MAKKLFQKGEVHGTGGARAGAGRKPDAFKWAMREIADSPKFVAWLRGIVDGDVATDADTRLKAWREARDSGYGKPMQAIEHSGSIDLEAEAAKAEIAKSVNAYLGDLLAKKS